MPIKLFDKKFLQVDPSDYPKELEGKEVFYGTDIQSIKEAVCKNVNKAKLVGREFEDFNLSENGETLLRPFIYYDPNYKYKVMYIDGTEIEFLIDNKWVPVSSIDTSSESISERIDRTDSNNIREKNPWWRSLKDALENGQAIEIIVNGSWCKLKGEFEAEKIDFNSLDPKSIRVFDPYREFEEAQDAGKTVWVFNGEEWVSNETVPFVFDMPVEQYSLIDPKDLVTNLQLCTWIAKGKGLVVCNGVVSSAYSFPQGEESEPISYLVKIYNFKTKRVEVPNKGIICS